MISAPYESCMSKDLAKQQIYFPECSPLMHFKNNTGKEQKCLCEHIFSAADINI